MNHVLHFYKGCPYFRGSFIEGSVILTYILLQISSWKMDLLSILMVFLIRVSPLIVSTTLAKSLVPYQRTSMHIHVCSTPVILSLLKQ